MNLQELVRLARFEVDGRRYAASPLRPAAWEPDTLRTAEYFEETIKKAVSLQPFDIFSKNGSACWARSSDPIAAWVLGLAADRGGIAGDYVEDA